MNQLASVLVDQVLSLCTLKSLEQFKSVNVAASPIWKKNAKRFFNYTNHTTIHRNLNIHRKLFSYRCDDPMYERFRYVEDSRVGNGFLFTENVEDLRDLPLANEGICMNVDHRERRLDGLSFLASYITEVQFFDLNLVDVFVYKRFCKSVVLRSLRFIRCTFMDSNYLPTDQMVDLIQKCPQFEGFTTDCLVKTDNFEMICSAISQHAKRAITFSVDVDCGLHHANLKESRSYLREFTKKHGLPPLKEKSENVFLEHWTRHTPIYVTIAPNSISQSL